MKFLQVDMVLLKQIMMEKWLERQMENVYSHGGFLIHSKQDTPVQGGINKDSPYYRNSPHYHLYHEATALAIQATANMLRDMCRDVNNDQLFGEYLGVFENQASAERSGSQVYSCNRNAMLQHHLNRIKGKELHNKTLP